jgi:hypothetical protein
MHARRAAALYISLRCSAVSVLAQQHRSMPQCRIVYRNVCMHMSAAASVECSSAVLEGSGFSCRGFQQLGAAPC